MNKPMRRWQGYKKREESKAKYDALYKTKEFKALFTSKRTCPFCGCEFEVGSGTNRKLLSKFCSNEHRKRYNSLARSL